MSPTGRMGALGPPGDPTDVRQGKVGDWVVIPGTFENRAIVGRIIADHEVDEHGVAGALIQTREGDYAFAHYRYEVIPEDVITWLRHVIGIPPFLLQ